MLTKHRGIGSWTWANGNRHLHDVAALTYYIARLRSMSSCWCVPRVRRTGVIRLIRPENGGDLVNVAQLLSISWGRDCASMGLALADIGIRHRRICMVV